MRGLVEAPNTRDLQAEFGDTVTLFRFPTAPTGKWLWDTLDIEFFQLLADPTFRLWTRRRDIPLGVKQHVIKVEISDTNFDPNTGVGVTNRRWELGANIPTTAFFRVRTTAGLIVVKQRSTVLSTDREVDWQPAHFWLDVPDELGAND